MGTRAASIVAVVLVTGCGGNAEYRCDSPGHSCGTGTCELTTGFCSVPDSSCASGRRYDGTLAGDLSGQCVGGGNPPSDGGVDVGIDTPPPPDARVCFGTAPYTICLAAPPTGTVAISMPTTFDTVNGTVTGTPLTCATTTSGGSNYCVIAAATISVDFKLRATGAKPLVLLASDTITVEAQIDVASHRGVTPETGAGADPASPACNAGTPPSATAGNGGGGAGGSLTGLGGSGGQGGNVAGAGGMPGAVIGSVTELRGGCPGQAGQGGADGGAFGHGGGAVMLIAGSKIDIAAVTINAAGEGGQGGQGNAAGAGGGGSGGMIALDAPMFTCNNSAILLAIGGGGGEGGDSAAQASGSNGSDANAGNTTPAPGGAGQSARGGDGGAGSVSKAVAGVNGIAGDNTAPNRGGGGGGGGGAGLIKSFAISTFCTQLAPAATP